MTPWPCGVLHFKDERIHRSGGYKGDHDDNNKVNQLILL